MLSTFWLQKCSFYVLEGGFRDVYNNLSNCAFIFYTFSICLVYIFLNKNGLKILKHPIEKIYFFDERSNRSC